MEWLNLHTSTLDAPEFLGSPPVERATWLCLLRFCIGQENGGVIIDAATFTDRKWLLLAGVTLREASVTTSALWKWEGANLRVWKYPAQRESDVIENRAAGRSGGLAKTEAKTQASRNNGLLGGRPKTQAETKAENPTAQTETQAENPTETQQNPTETQQNPTEGEGEGEGERKDKGKGRGTNPSVSPPPKQADSKSRCTYAEVAAFFLEQGFGPPWLDPSFAENEASKFVDFYESKGWRVGSAPMRDWRAAARNWIRKWLESPQAQKLRAPNSPPPDFDPTAPNAHTGGLADAGADEKISDSTAAPEPP